MSIFDMENCKPNKTTIATNAHLNLNKEGKPIDQSIYHSLIGSCFTLPHLGPILCLVCAYVPESYSMKQSLLDYNIKLGSVPLLCDNKMRHAS
jgi:hypothetical protein